MSLKKISVLVISLTLGFSTGCATRTLSLSQCAAIGAAAGAGAGGGVGSTGSSNDWIAAGIAIGAVVGAASGWLICKAMPEAEVAVIPEPEPEPEPAPPPSKPEPRVRVVLRGVNFDFDSAALIEGSQAVIDIAAETLLANPTVSVSVEGHTDAVGPAEYNRELSRRRAKAVLDMLVSAGVSAERLEVVAHGEDQPLANNDTADGRSINRRVQLVTGD